MFINFCRTLADGRTVDSPLFDSEENSLTVPHMYEKASNVLIKNMKIKKDIFDKVDIPYIEAAFTDDYTNILEDKLEDGDVPDGLITHLSFGIYGKNLNKLSDDERTIIKVLSVYICIQN